MNSTATKADYRLRFGPLTAMIFLVGVIGLAAALPGYSQVHQTVSEIGEIGSPMRFPFTVMLSLMALCILVFAAGLRQACLVAGHSTWAAYFVGYMAIPCIGLGIFSSPHPLHNVFGLSEIVGYQAPAVLAFTWRADPRTRGLVAVSWVAFVLVWLAMGLNMAGLAPHSALWAAVKPVIGIAQRALFGSWFGWIAIVGVLLSRPGAEPQAAAP